MTPKYFKLKHEESFLMGLYAISFPFEYLMHTLYRLITTEDGFPFVTHDKYKRDEH